MLVDWLVHITFDDVMSGRVTWSISGPISYAVALVTFGTEVLQKTDV